MVAFFVLRQFRIFRQLLPSNIKARFTVPHRHPTFTLFLRYFYERFTAHHIFNVKTTSLAATNK